MLDMPKLEKIWLAIGIGSLFIFLLITGILAVSMGLNPPDGMEVTGEPELVDTVPPFNQTGVEKIGPNEYEVTMLSFMFGYDPSTISIPKGAKVHFKMTSKDVVHGLHIAGTPLNFMLVPGRITEYSYTFQKPGEYLFVCHEYCGIGHQVMYGKVIVED